MSAPVHITSRPLEYVEMAGMAAMALSGTHPRWKFTVYDGDRRRFADRTSGGATLTAIQGGKENQ